MPAPPLKPTTINATLFARHDETAGGETRRKRDLALRRAAAKKRTEKETGIGNTEGVEDKAVAAQEQGKVILVNWEENDDEDPMNWPNSRKWRMTILLCLMTLFIGLATSAFSVGIDEMCAEFGVDSEVGQVGMFVFNAAFSVAPLFASPLSDSLGRNPVYLSCYLCFTLFFLALALGQNIWTIIIGRFFSGVFGAAGTTMVGGTLSDIWKTSERSVPMAIFSFVAVLGTILAPLYSGFILQAKGWRWIQWVQLIVNGAMCVVEFAFLRETRGAIILAKRARKMRKSTGDGRFRAPIELERDSYSQKLREDVVGTFQLLWKEPVVFFFSLWISFSWGVMFLFFTVIPLTFGGNHRWATGIAGLGYSGLVIGTCLGFATNFIQDHLYDRATEANGGVARPEARLYGAMVGGVLFPVGLWWFSWTQFGHIHWIVPEIALVFVILGIYHIFLATYNYLTDSYGSNASSAVSAQGFMRNGFAASFPLFGGYMFKGMGYQWAGTLLSCLATLAIPFPFYLYKYGPTIRKNSRFAAAVTGANDDNRESDEEKRSGPREEPGPSSTIDEEDGHTDVDEIDEDDTRALDALEQEAGDRTAVNSREPSIDGGRRKQVDA